MQHAAPPPADQSQGPPDLSNSPPDWVGDLDSAALSSAEATPPRLQVPQELVIQPGSFTVSTLAVLMVLFLAAVTMVALGASGLIAGLGLGLAMLTMVV